MGSLQWAWQASERGASARTAAQTSATVVQAQRRQFCGDRDFPAHFAILLQRLHRTVSFRARFMHSFALKACSVNGETSMILHGLLLTRSMGAHAATLTSSAAVAAVAAAATPVARAEVRPGVLPASPPLQLLHQLEAPRLRSVLVAVRMKIPEFAFLWRLRQTPLKGCQSHCTMVDSAKNSDWTGDLRNTDVEKVGGKSASLGEMISQLSEAHLLLYTTLLRRAYGHKC
eukprot:2597381-Amphidinium_carterae.1